MNKNNKSDLILTNHSYLDVFSACSGQKAIFMQNTTPLKYSILALESDLHLSINTDRDDAELKVFVLMPIFGSQGSKITIDMNLRHHRCKIDLHIVSLVFSGAQSHASATIFMEQGIQNSASTLLEETVILSDSINVKNLPILDIQANNIAAAHGAKIYRLDPQKIFYLESKGLSAEQARALLISSYPNMLFDQLPEEIQQQKQEIIQNFLTFDHYLHA